jgi:hypothetical protein
VARAFQLSVAAFACTLIACGRLGFEPAAFREATAQEPGPDGVEVPPGDDGDEPPPLDDADAGALDAGEPTKDKSDDPPEPWPDAGQLPGAEDAAAPPYGDDASTPPVVDAGGGGTGAFDCADYPGAIGCASFDDSTPSNLYLQNTSGTGDVWISDGVLYADTEGSGSDAYAGLTFPRIYSGDLYLRVNVMFPSNGELESINFVTVGNYYDGSDYGVELDVVNGNLAFNSAADGWTYSDFAVPRDQWICMHTWISLDRYDGEMMVEVDGTNVLSVSGWTTVPSDGTRVLHLGIDWTRRYQDSGRVRINDFVLSRDPVPCE